MFNENCDENVLMEQAGEHSSVIIMRCPCTPRTTAHRVKMSSAQETHGKREAKAILSNLGLGTLLGLRTIVDGSSEGKGSHFAMVEQVLTRCSTINEEGKEHLLVLLYQYHVHINSMEYHNEFGGENS
jgi:hypothetical protein